MMKTYHGSCHCGAVKFEADLDLTQSSYRCNCSICRRTRFWPAVARPPIDKMHGVNLGCLDDMTDEELSRVPITYVDGLHDQMNAPAFFAHL